MSVPANHLLVVRVGEGEEEGIEEGRERGEWAVVWWGGGEKKESIH